MADQVPPTASSASAEIFRELTALRAAGLEQMQLLQLMRYVQLDRAGSPDAPSALAQAQLLDIEARRAEAAARLGRDKLGVQGRLVDEAGTPVAGAEVEALGRADHPLATGTTDSGGYYSLRIAAAKATPIGIVVRLAGKIAHREPAVSLGPDQLLHLDIQLSRALP